MRDITIDEAKALRILSSALSCSTEALGKQLGMSEEVDEIAQKLESDGFATLTPNPITAQTYISPTSRGLKWYREHGSDLVQSSEKASAITP